MTISMKYDRMYWLTTGMKRFHQKPDHSWLIHELKMLPPLPDYTQHQHTRRVNLFMRSALYGVISHMTYAEFATEIAKTNSRRLLAQRGCSKQALHHLQALWKALPEFIHTLYEKP